MAVSRKILVVDDHPHVCEVISDVLEQAGVDVVCARTDGEAYEALQHQGPFDALVVDVNLGVGTTGFDVARAARAKARALHVVYVSGEADEGSFRAFGVTGSTFLFKPFSPSELLAALKLQRSGGEPFSAGVPDLASEA